MARINALLTATTKPRILTILVILTIINFAVIGSLTVQIGAVSGGETLLDFSFGHTVEDVTTTLSNYGQDGIALYRWVQRIDLVHPLVYSLLFATLMFLLFRQTRFNYLVLLPFGMGALDYLENIFLFMMVNSFPNINSIVVQMASLSSFAKNGVTYLTIFVFLVGLFIRRRIK